MSINLTFNLIGKKILNLITELKNIINFISLENRNQGNYNL